MNIYCPKLAKILPQKAFADFSLSEDDTSRENFTIFTGKLNKKDQFRISELEELKDTFRTIGIKIKNKKILDIGRARINS